MSSGLWAKRELLLKMGEK